MDVTKPFDNNFEFVPEQGMNPYLIVFNYSGPNGHGVGNTCMQMDCLSMKNILEVSENIKNELGFKEIAVTNIIRLDNFDGFRM